MSNTNYAEKKAAREFQELSGASYQSSLVFARVLRALMDKGLDAGELGDILDEPVDGRRPLTIPATVKLSDLQTSVATLGDQLEDVFVFSETGSLCLVNAALVIDVDADVDEAFIEGSETGAWKITPRALRAALDEVGDAEPEDGLVPLKLKGWSTDDFMFAPPNCANPGCLARITSKLRYVEGTTITGVEMSWVDVDFAELGVDDADSGDPYDPLEGHASADPDRTSLRLPFPLLAAWRLWMTTDAANNGGWDDEDDAANFAEEHIGDEATWFGLDVPWAAVRVWLVAPTAALMGEPGFMARAIVNDSGPTSTPATVTLPDFAALYPVVDDPDDQAMRISPQQAVALWITADRHAHAWQDGVIDDASLVAALPASVQPYATDTFIAAVGKCFATLRDRVAAGWPNGEWLARTTGEQWALHVVLYDLQGAIHMPAGLTAEQANTLIGLPKSTNEGPGRFAGTLYESQLPDADVEDLDDVGSDAFKLGGEYFGSVLDPAHWFDPLYPEVNGDD